MNADEMVHLSRRYTLYDWQAQDSANPIPEAELDEGFAVSNEALAIADKSVTA